MRVLPLCGYCVYFISQQFKDINKDVKVTATGKGEATLTVSKVSFLFGDTTLL